MAEAEWEWEQTELAAIVKKAPRVTLTRLGRGDNVQAVALRERDAERIIAALEERARLEAVLRELLESLAAWFMVGQTPGVISSSGLVPAMKEAHALLAQTRGEEGRH